MKNIIYTLISSLVVAIGLIFTIREIKEVPSKTDSQKPLSADEMKAELKKWEATPDGINFNKWKASPEGKKVLTDAAKINNLIKSSSNIEAVITSLSLPPGSRLGFGMMVNINGDDYILSFGPKKSNEFQQLKSLKVNDKIILKSNFVSYAPKYSYPIIAGENVTRDGEIIYKKAPNKNGC